MKIGIIDADLIGRKKHRFPNLASMKLSAYHKEQGDDVTLICSYDNMSAYDKVYVSKVFTDTIVPDEIINMPNVECGGTGFYYDKAQPLPYEIEHHMPDYHLYDEWVNCQLANGGKKKDFIYYTDYSIGFLTRGCFRGCEFCVNKNYKKCVAHSQLKEFLDTSRPKICLLDDNFFACSEWRSLIDEVKASGKSFQFKQGLDERLLTDDKIHELVTWKYDGHFLFAFDNLEDKELIESKLQRLYELYPNFKKQLKFYVLCGYDRELRWDDEFWHKDIHDTFERIKILSKYSALPYIMRYEKCYASDYVNYYTVIAGWCNQPNMFKKFSFRDYCKCKGMDDYAPMYKMDVDRYLREVGIKYSAWRYMESLESAMPSLAEKYFDLRPCDLAEYGVDCVV